MIVDNLSYRKKSEGVFVASSSIVKPTREIVSELVRERKGAMKNSARLLLHESINDILHQMIIVHSGGMYIRPHINSFSDKSWHVIEGELEFVKFDESGEAKEHFRVGPYDSELPFIVRLSERAFHTLIPISGHTVVLETILGPFCETVYAQWAPSGENPEAAEAYLGSLCVKLGVKF